VKWSEVKWRDFKHRDETSKSGEKWKMGSEVKFFRGMCVLWLIYSFAVCTWVTVYYVVFLLFLCVFWLLLCSNYSFYVFVIRFMFVFLFCMLCFLFCVFCVFVLFCVLFLLAYIIVVSFLLASKFTDHCHRVETELQLIKYIISYHTCHIETLCNQ
jgi:phosphatidylserine synthase